jgi:oligopeptide transport system permease protein
MAMSTAVTVSSDEPRAVSRGLGAITQSLSGLIGLAVLAGMFLVCVGTLPWTLAESQGTPAYAVQLREATRLPPWWWRHNDAEAARLESAGRALALRAVAAERGTSVEALTDSGFEPSAELIEASKPRFWLGTDVLGRDVLTRCLVGGGISLGIGLAAAGISVLLGTLYGSIAAYAGGRVDAVMMRVVDVLYGLPYILLVVLFAVASDALIEEYVSRGKARAAWTLERAAEVARERGSPTDDEAVRELLRSDAELARSLGAEADSIPRLKRRELSDGQRTALDLATLLVAIGGVSWLTMARVVRGQVLSLKAQPFMEAARAIGLPWHRQFFVHLLPNLVGVVVVYATLTVPQAVLQESFLSFLGIGVSPPMPSWGNLAADGLEQLNPVSSRWWLLLFPCVLLGVTLLALNFVGEGLREALDPKRSSR